MKIRNTWAMRAMLTAGFITGLVAPFQSANAEVREQSFRLASVQVAEHPFSMGGKRFAELIEKKSGGKMKAKLFTGGTLGGDAQVISSLQGGTIDGTFVSTGLIAPMDKNFEIYYLPMAFKSMAAADRVVDGPFGKKMLDRLPAQGLIGLTYWEHGFRDVSNNKRPITKLEDFEGLKLRTIQIPLFVDIYKALGTNPVPMGWTELYTALEQKALDGQETGLPSFNAARLYEVQKYLSLTNIVYDPLLVLFSKKKWDTLNADEQKILVDSAKEATGYQRKLNRETINQLVTKPGGGMLVNDISPAERARMKDRLKAVVEAHSKDYDPALLAEFLAEVDKSNKAEK